jgi:CDGSH-type Zn-finger protein
MTDKKAIEAGTFPLEVELEAGKKYFWCTCGQSANQPLCDGAHKGTEFVPLMHEAVKTESKWFCTCKKTKKAPFCDGSHSKA